MLPLASRPAPAQLPGGASLVIADLIVVPVLAVLTMLRGLAAAPWPGIVVIAGLLLLAGPFLLQPLPPPIRDGRAGLAVLFVLCVLALLA